jgi:hypothetical protein
MSKPYAHCHGREGTRAGHPWVFIVEAFNPRLWSELPMNKDSIMPELMWQSIVALPLGLLTLACGVEGFSNLASSTLLQDVLSLGTKRCVDEMQRLVPQPCSPAPCPSLLTSPELASAPFSAPHATFNLPYFAGLHRLALQRLPTRRIVSLSPADRDWKGRMKAMNQGGPKKCSQLQCLSLLSETAMLPYCLDVTLGLIGGSMSLEVWNSG